MNTFTNFIKETLTTFFDLRYRFDILLLITLLSFFFQTRFLFYWKFLSWKLALSFVTKFHTIHLPCFAYHFSYGIPYFYLLVLCWVKILAKICNISFFWAVNWNIQFSTWLFFLDILLTSYSFKYECNKY